MRQKYLYFTYIIFACAQKTIILHRFSTEVPTAKEKY